MSRGRKFTPEEGLRSFLLARGVPDNGFAKAIANCERIAAKARLKAKAEIAAKGITRPKWAKRSGELRKLSAPKFMRTVYPDAFKNGKLIDEDLVRVSDWRLVQAVQQYVSKRKARNIDAGDAAGIDLTPNRYGHGGFRGKGPVKGKASPTCT